MKKSQSNGKQVPLTVRAAARIQSNSAKANDGKVSSKSFAARAQAAAARNTNR